MNSLEKEVVDFVLGIVNGDHAPCGHEYSDKPWLRCTVCSYAIEELTWVLERHTSKVFPSLHDDL